MVSSRYVSMSPRGFIKTMSSAKGSDAVGGAVPQLLNKIIKEPVKGGALDEMGKSNRIVGTITAGIERSSPATPKERIKMGGELIENLQNLQFKKKGKQRKDQNIRFIVD